jgi:hypothetical protein
VSMIRFTHSIWVMVKGDSVPISEPSITMIHAATFIVSWKARIVGCSCIMNVPTLQRVLYC